MFSKAVSQLLQVSLKFYFLSKTLCYQWKVWASFWNDKLVTSFVKSNNTIFKIYFAANNYYFNTGKYYTINITLFVYTGNMKYFLSSQNIECTLIFMLFPNSLHAAKYFNTKRKLSSAAVKKVLIQYVKICLMVTTMKWQLCLLHPFPSSMRHKDACEIVLLAQNCYSFITRLHSQVSNGVTNVLSESWSES